MKATIRDNADLAEFIGKISLIDRKDKTWVGTFEPVKKKRSLSANALYWLWIAHIATETGCDKNNKDETEAIHNALREKFLPVKTKDIAGRRLKILTSTTSLTTAEFTRYMDSIKLHMITEYAIDLPLPEDRLYQELINRYT